MSVDKLVDSTQLDTDLTSVANAIRAKSGGSSQLAFPAGFVSEIQAIPSGGGSTSGEIDSDYGTLSYAIVTVGSNSVANAFQVYDYLLGLAGFSTTGYKHAWYSVIDHGSWIANEAICTDLSQNALRDSSLASGSNNGKFYRYKNGAISSTAVNSSYDAKLKSGDKYLICVTYPKGAPTV